MSAALAGFESTWANVCVGDGVRRQMAGTCTNTQWRRAHPESPSARARAPAYMRDTHTRNARAARERVYVVQRGPCSLGVCGSAVSHTPPFLRNQCMHTTESCHHCRRAHAHTETESAANALTYGLFLRGRRRSRRTLARVCACASVHACVGLSKPRKLSYLGQAFSRFKLYPDTRGICFIKRARR